VVGSKDQLILTVGRAVQGPKEITVVLPIGKQMAPIFEGQPQGTGGALGLCTVLWWWLNTSILWGPTSGRTFFTLTEAGELLGTILVSMCQICPWGIFLFQNLYHAMYQPLTSNATHTWHSKEFRPNIALCDSYSKHPTDSSTYRFLAGEFHCWLFGILSPSLTYPPPFVMNLLSLLKSFPI
jgi:hypothetical protein